MMLLSDFEDRKGRPRVVITGMGAMTCLGKSAEEFWDALKKGKSGIRFMQLIDTTDYSCKVGGEVQNFDPQERMNRREARRMGRFSQLAVCAAHEALASASLDMAQEKDVTRAGVIIGCGSGGLPETNTQAMRQFVDGSGRVSPLYIPAMLINMAAANISRIFGANGYTNTCATACAAGTQSVGEALEIIRRGAADLIITGGTEAGICELGMGGFSIIGALTKWDGEPSKASRPFDSMRDGFVPAEAAGILIVESMKHAYERGAEPLAEVSGYGATSDAYHLVQPDITGSGAARSMEAAVQDANISIGDVDYINAHGTSTPINDKAETMALKRLFGERAYKIPISSTKSMVGHSLGSSGAIEAIASVYTIRDNIIHPTINQEVPDPDCDLDYVPNKARPASVQTVLSNSFGFGGQNASIVIRRFEEK